MADGFIFNFHNDDPGNIITNKTGWVSNENGENELFSLSTSELDGLTTGWGLTITPDRNGDVTNFVEQIMTMRYCFNTWGWFIQTPFRFDFTNIHSNTAKFNDWGNSRTTFNK